MTGEFRHRMVMSTATLCPRCDGQVRLPVFTEPDSDVQCPLCDSQFPLQEAIDNAPPELIVVGRSSGAAGTPGVGAGMAEVGAGFLPDLAALPPQARNRTHFFRQVFQVVAGGMAGLVMGYMILLWIGGPSKDFLRLGSKLPAFLVPAEFHGFRGSPQTVDDEPIDAR